jgi:hypothetical protein
MKKKINKFCLDSDLLIFLVERGYKNQVVLIPNNWLDNKPTKNYYSRQNKFIDMAQTKTVIFQQIAMRGLDFLFSDCDVVFLSEHVNVKFNLIHSFAEIIFALARPRPRMKEYNTGFFMQCRPNSSSHFSVMCAKDHTMTQVRVLFIEYSTKECINQSDIWSMDSITFCTRQGF